MPKSKHRKDHKKKVRAYKDKLKQKRKLFYNKMREQFGKELADRIEKIGDKENKLGE